MKKGISTILEYLVLVVLMLIIVIILAKAIGTQHIWAKKIPTFDWTQGLLDKLR